MKRIAVVFVILGLLCCAAAAAGAGYLDGTYEGSAQGRNAPIFVEVTVMDGAVADIRIDGHNETPSRFQLAMQIIPQMIGARSDDEIEAIDAVSGATLSCSGIKNAVLNALQHAKQSLAWQHGADEPCPGAAFTDMPPCGDWAHEAIDWAVCTGLTQGVSETRFAPDAVCTRAQVVTFLWRAAGEPILAGSVPFSDVSADAYYQKAVLWAVETGITTGTSETSFAPDAPCTRAQVVTFLWRAAGKPAAQDAADAPFSDVPAGSYYADAVRWAVKAGITTGTSSAAFSPESSCTRAQIAAFLYRYRVG